VIPKCDTIANVGIGVRRSFMRREYSPRKLLDEFIANHPVVKERFLKREIVTVASDILPVGGPISKTFNDPVLAVGDAAGMVMPTNGGGITTAMITGKIAGETATKHLNNGNSLSDYEQEWRMQIENQLNDSKKMREIADKFIGNDFLLHCILTMLGTGRIKEVMSCKVPTAVVPFLKLA